MTPSIGAGTLHSVTIPGTTSRFDPRPAEVWVPSDASTSHHVPVVMLLHGTDGGPTDWVVKGHLPAVVASFASEHEGQAPLVVMPDINGSRRADTECIRSGSGADVERYLEADVPTFIERHYPVLSAPDHWAVGGLSEGGTCAIMIALRADRQFHTFIDLSGLTRPTVTDHDDPSATIKDLFGGSVNAYNEHDPLWLMARHSYAGLGGWFECGGQDPTVLAAQRKLVTAAASADIELVARVIPGAHQWTVWTASLTTALPWVWDRIRA